MTPIKRFRGIIKNVILPAGERPRVIRGGALRGMRFGLDLRATTQTWRGIYEVGLQQWLARNVAPGNTCLDVGAKDGYFTLLMARLAGPDGAVHAFEPDPEHRKIAENFALNPDVPLARLCVHPHFAGSSTEGEKTVALDDLLASGHLPAVHVVKIDVDGGEMDVLRGMKLLLQTLHPRLFVEVHSEALCQAVQEFAGDLGYRLKLEHPPRHEYRPIGFNPSLMSEE
jgi:hypothetical protein